MSQEAAQFTPSLKTVMFPIDFILDSAINSQRAPRNIPRSLLIHV